MRRARHVSMLLIPNLDTSLSSTTSPPSDHPGEPGYRGPRLDETGGLLLDFPVAAEDGDLYGCVDHKRIRS
jgi:hypothetical protein